MKTGATEKSGAGARHGGKLKTMRKWRGKQNPMSGLSELYVWSLNNLACSVREVEIIIGVVIVLSLTQARADEVERAGNKCDSQPNLAAVVYHVSLDEELSCTTVHEVEEPLLGGVGSVVPDVASCET